MGIRQAKKTFSKSSKTLIYQSHSKAKPVAMNTNTYAHLLIHVYLAY